MNGEWIYLEIARWTLSLVLLYIGYILGIRSQKKQGLREYITETVKDEYPVLFQEMKRNSETLDNYLENPNVNFDFPELSQIYDTGLDGFMKRHHKDLHVRVDSFRRNILPKFYELSVKELMDRLFGVFSKHLTESLPKELVSVSDMIAVDLAKSINPYYIIPDLLNERYKEVRNKIEACILYTTSHIREERRKRPYVIRGQQTAINFDAIAQSLIEKAKPEIAILIKAHKELKKENDKEVRGKLLPLLQKYISNPI